MSVSGMSPDIDGLGLIIDFSGNITGITTDYWSQFHHELHTLPFALFIAVISAYCARGRKLLIGCSSFLMFHLHLLCDIVGSKGPDGYQWPIPYLSPLYTEINLSVPWQWELNAWQNIVIAIIFFVITYKLIKIKGESPLELVSKRMNRALVKIVKKETV